MRRWKRALTILALLALAALVYFVPQTAQVLSLLQSLQPPAQTTAPSPTVPAQSVPFDLAAVPAFQGEPWVEINGNVPYFGEEELADLSPERYSELDELGRCGPAFARVSREGMPTGEREGIGQYKPSGWHTVRYDDLIDGKYLYNRCHLIGYQLTGENGETRNLITGTRYLNIKGMLPYENKVADYVKTTGNAVLYRVTPVFQDDELVARGVLMEAQSVGDGGEGLRFCVYAYNVQPGVDIDYLTGESRRCDGEG